MEDVIIIVVIIIIAAVGVHSTVKHFKGQSGCCGGSSYKPKKKKLSGIICQKRFKVEGMHCGHCKNRVEELVNDIRGAAGRVSLKKGELTVSCAEDIDDSLIISRIERAGYKAERI